MAKRDPQVTLRNKRIRELTAKIKELLPEVLRVTGYKSETSLNGTYGGKYADYIDIKNEVIDTPQQFRTLYYQGFLNVVKEKKSGIFGENVFHKAFRHFKDNSIVREWLELFLERTFLRNYNDLTKVRPTVEDSIMWIGQENASYGLLVTPRFKNGQWENDKSEIRRFKPAYWTIGHILETGLVVPGDDDKITFPDIESYLSFFKNTLVRNSGSSHEYAIAQMYCEFVRESKDPLNVPLLISEFRYGGLDKKHTYRLDFTIINPYNMTKVGFELSPWSSHGLLRGTKGKLQKTINAEAQANFAKEMRKSKDYFRKYKITILICTDEDLQDHDNLFDVMKEYLTVEKASKQLEMHALNDLLGFDIENK